VELIERKRVYYLSFEKFNQRKVQGIKVSVWCKFDLPKWRNIMFNRILVPLDGSLLAERALPHAMQFARIFGSRIILLRVLNPISYHENPDAIDPLKWQIQKAEADMYMSGISTRLCKELEKYPMDKDSLKNEEIDDCTTRVEYSILEGKTAENIVNFAHTENIDLLVISTHGASGLSRWSLSSVTQKVINLIYLPVLIVRAYNHPTTENARVHYHRILLPIDSSRRAECSLSAGIALARGESKKRTLLGEKPVTTKLVLAAVLKPPEVPIPEPYPEKIEQLSEQLMQIGRLSVNNYLVEMKERLPVESEFCVVENTSVCSAIQELADQDEAIDLVVLCAHGYTGRSTWPYGSVARNYMEHGTKNVLVIQDLPRSKVQPTVAELASDKAGGL
jgi:nucleotide-binding universal stress UspA family protein